MPKTLKAILVGIVFLSLPVFVSADYIGQRVTFFVDPSYDTEGRNQITATLREINSQAYFYVDNSWWDSLDYTGREELVDSLKSLGQEFEEKIYPVLTSTFGSEWSAGIDNDRRITVLIHSMGGEAKGYFNAADEYPTAQAPTSNEREMVYLNAGNIVSPLAKSFLAHEFVHLITFNQKEKIQGVFEETWLNEARAEYAPSLLGYDSEYEGSYLEKRVKNFLENPYDSLTEWRNRIDDYGVANVFVQYLLDHYGKEILVDSLSSEKVGIESLNYALKKNGFGEDFSLIFTQWTIAVLVNDPNLGEKYSYFNPDLQYFHVTPRINFLPFVPESTLSITEMTFNWAGNWHKIVGGKGTLTLEFNGSNEVDFQVPYVVCDEKCSISVLNLDENQDGQLILSDFGKTYTSLTIIPSIQTKISGFDGFESSFPFSWTATIVEKTEGEKEAELIQELLVQIDFLQKEIAKIQAQINAILAERGQLVSCQKFENNLYYGLVDNLEVKCLQEFLKAQGPEIYPEGLVTGNFLSLTQGAVIRFQEKYSADILAPLGLEEGTGFLGQKTRVKINQILGS